MPAQALRAGIDRLGGRYDVRIAGDITRATGFLAGSDERRAEELNRHLRDPDVRGILLARGGYGIMRILPLLDAGALRGDPKPLVGFSDATVLLSWAALAAGVRGIHGPVVAQLGKLPADDTAWLCQLLEGGGVTGRPVATGLVGAGAPAGGRVEGPLVGGNLALLCHLVGTPYQVDCRGAVLLLEDVGEKPYAIDRYLTHMQMAGGLAGASAALVGDLVLCADAGYPAVSAADVVHERLVAMAVPALTGAPIGHGARNLAVPFGGRCALELDAGTFALLEPAVR